MVSALAEANLQKPDYSDPALFVTLRNVPVFSECDTVTPEKGVPVHVRRPHLEKLAARHNAEIAATGDYPQLCVGHTGKNSADEKPSVGSIGPFSVGLIPKVYEDEDGNIRERMVFALLADMHVRTDSESLLTEYPKRSLDLLTPKNADGSADLDHLQINNLALLGANAPCFPLGVTGFSAVQGGHANGVEMLCFQAVTPSATNVFIPSPVDTKPERTAHAAESTPSPIQETPQMALSPEDLKQIAIAIMQTKPMQWVVGKMKEEEDEAAEPEAEVTPEVAAPADPVAEPPAAVPAKPEHVEASACTTPEALKMSALESQLAAMQLQFSALNDKAAKDNEARVNAERKAAISNWHWSRVMDQDAEFEQCQFSAMNDSQFLDRLEQYKSCYRPIATGQTVFVPPQAEPERHAHVEEQLQFSKAASSKALAKVMEKKAAGDKTENGVLFDICYQEALKELGGAK